MMLETAKARNWQDNRQCRGRCETTEPRFNDQVHVAAPQNFNSAMIPAIDINLDTTYSCVRIFYHVTIKIIITEIIHYQDIQIFMETNAAESNLEFYQYNFFMSFLAPCIGSICPWFMFLAQTARAYYFDRIRTISYVATTADKILTVAARSSDLARLLVSA